MNLHLLPSTSALFETYHGQRNWPSTSHFGAIFFASKAQGTFEPLVFVCQSSFKCHVSHKTGDKVPKVVMHVRRFLFIKRYPCHFYSFILAAWTCGEGGGK